MTVVTSHLNIVTTGGCACLAPHWGECIINIIILQHNMATAVDKEAIKEAYNEVMADKNGVEW